MSIDVNRLVNHECKASLIPSDVDSSRLRAAAQIQAHDIQSVDVNTVERLKALAGHGDQLHVWSTPQNWLVHSSRMDAIEAVNLRAAALSALTIEERSTINVMPSAGNVITLTAEISTAQLIDSIVLQAVRYLLLLRLGPSVNIGSVASTASLKPTVIASLASGAIRRMLTIITRKRFDLLSQGMLAVDDRRFFALIQQSDLVQLPKTFAVSCAAELHRMDRLHGRGLWFDAPLPIRANSITVDPTLPPMIATPEPRPSPHLPLPDEYVAQLGQRSLWIIEHLGPFLLDVSETLLTEWRNSALRGRCSKDTRKQILLKVLAARTGRCASRPPTSPLRCPTPPFTIHLSTHGEENGQRFRRKSIVSQQEERDETKPLKAIVWPPSNLAHYIGLCGVLQGAHFFIVSMAMAARQSESMTLSRSCVAYEQGGQYRAVGRTFKLVQNFEGELREWNLPEVAAGAIEQQARLVKILEQMPWFEDLSALLNPEFTAFTGDHLWCSFGTNLTNPRVVPRNPNSFLRKFARTLGMDTSPGGQPLRTHRFRKTIARLAALAVDEAPLMLKHLFGHKNIEMTLHYILADRSLAAEIEQLTKELHILRAEGPVKTLLVELMGSAGQGVDTKDHEVNYSSYGGKAVARLADTVKRFRDRVGGGDRMRNSSEDFGADQIDDVVRILTGEGTYFNLVRPGVICTKRLGEWGPCSRKKGQADRSNCQETCDHRLEEPWQRADADGCVADALAGYERACKDNEVLLQSFWSDQVRRNLVRFEDIHAKWKHHPVIAQIMAEDLATPVHTK